MPVWTRKGSKHSVKSSKKNAANVSIISPMVLSWRRPLKEPIPCILTNGRSLVRWLISKLHEENDYKQFYTDFYVPNNAVLSIAGDIDFDEAKMYIEKYFAGIPKSAKAVYRPRVVEPALTCRNQGYHL